MASETIHERLHKWQRRLRLEDWRITIELVPDRMLPDRWAEASIDVDHMQAHLRLEDEISRAGRATERFTPSPTIDESLVHELVEIVLFELCGEIDNVTKEIAINRIVAALMPLDKS